MENVPAQFALLRLAVGWLGQSGQGNWWRSSFLGETGLAFGAYNFARAPRLAAYSATFAAAKRVHDDRIGRSHTFHLFRLRLEDEIRVHRAAAEGGCTLFEPLKLSSCELMQFVEQTAGEAIDAPVGPVQVGPLEHAFTEEALQELAKHYLSAFRQGTECFPYFARGRA
jgi:hypothetical protein